MLKGFMWLKLDGELLGLWRDTGVQHAAHVAEYYSAKWAISHLLGSYYLELHLYAHVDRLNQGRVYKYLSETP